MTNIIYSPPIYSQNRDSAYSKSAKKNSTSIPHSGWSISRNEDQQIKRFEAKAKS